jgi:hypothetical protein
MDRRRSLPTRANDGETLARHVVLATFRGVLARACQPDGPGDGWCALRTVRVRSSGLKGRYAIARVGLRPPLTSEPLRPLRAGEKGRPTAMPHMRAAHRFGPHRIHNFSYEESPRFPAIATDPSGPRSWVGEGRLHRELVRPPRRPTARHRVGCEQEGARSRQQELSPLSDTLAQVSERR